MYSILLLKSLRHSLFYCKIFLINLCLTFPLLGGCSPTAPTPDAQNQVKGEPTPSTKSTPDASQKAQKTSSTPNKMVDGETYFIYYPTTPLSSSKGQQTIKVVPKPGYKVNLEFPHRIQVAPSSTLKVKSASVLGKITKKQLHYQVDVEGQNGEHTLQAKADFSICNEEMCKLYRATPVKWTTQIKKP